MAQPERVAVPAIDPRPDPIALVPPPLDGFEDFYRASYRDLVVAAMIAGATPEEAKDAASTTMAEMLKRWPVPGHPLRFARKAVVNNFIKAKTRGIPRVASRLVERGHVPHSEGAVDESLTALDDCDWVADVLSNLPPGQREVMQCIADGLDREEIAKLLGKTPATIRRRICDARARLAQLLSPDGDYKQQERQPANTRREEAR